MRSDEEWICRGHSWSEEFRIMHIYLHAGKPRGYPDVISAREKTEIE